MLFQLIDIHNIYLIKIVSISVIFLNGFIVTELSKRIFDSGIIERVVVFALVVTHPLYYAVALDGSGIVDPVFNSFLNLFLICFIDLLEGVNTKISATAGTVGNRGALAALSCLFMVCAITSHERGLAAFAMIGALTLFYYYDQIRRRKLKFDNAIVAVAAFGILVFLAYMYFVFGAKQQWSGADYRTVFEPQYVLSNLIKAVTLPFRLDFHDMGKGYDVHNESVFNFLALPFIIALAAYVVAVVRGSDSREKSRLTVVTLLYLCALPIPVWFGGNAWHFYTAALYVSIATGRAVCFWLAAIARNAYLPPSLLAVLFIWLIVSTVRGINQEMPTEETGPMYMLYEAQHDETLHKVKTVPEAVYYDTGSYGAFTWPFGGQGNLFKYLYSNPNIVEIALVNGKVLESDKPLCALAAGKKTLYFGFDVEHFSWHTIPEKDYCAL